MAALRHFYRNIGEKLWGDFGFRDAFNLDQNWYAKSYLAIDEGPIVAMIENHRSGLLWELFMQTPEIAPALDAIGFVPDPAVATLEVETTGFELAVSPNPAPPSATVTLKISVSEPATLSATLSDGNGKPLRTLSAPRRYTAGVYPLPFEAKDLASGVYFIQVTDALTGQNATKKFMIH